MASNFRLDELIRRYPPAGEEAEESPQGQRRSRISAAALLDVCQRLRRLRVVIAV